MQEKTQIFGGHYLEPIHLGNGGVGDYLTRIFGKATTFGRTHLVNIGTNGLVAQCEDTKI
jgi:hypothetical protein